MKIAIDASKYGQAETTGVELYCHEIINGILDQAKNRKDVKILLYSRRKLQLKKKPSNAKNVVLPFKRFWTLYHLSLEMLRKKPDVLFVPGHVLPFFCPEKSVVTIHDVAFKYLHKAYSFSQFHYLNWSTKRAVKMAERIIVPSAATAHDLEALFNCPPEKIEIIPHGFDARAFRKRVPVKKMKSFRMLRYFGLSEKNNYFLFVGRLESKKNLERVASAFKDFLEDNANFKLILAGKRGVGFNELLKKIRLLGIEENVLMPGYVNEVEKMLLLKNARAFIFPSLYEGFGFPLLEAFALDIPVLTSHVSSLPEVAGDAAYYVDPYDEKSIFFGMQKMSSDINYRKKLILLGRERLQNFSWIRVVKQTFKLLYDK